MGKILDAIRRALEEHAEHGTIPNRIRMAPYTLRELKSECSYEEFMSIERDGLSIEIMRDCPPDNIYVDVWPK